MNKIKSKGVSLIEICIVMILSLFFISGTSYALSLAERVSKAKEMAYDLIDIRDNLNASKISYPEGKSLSAVDFINDKEKGNNYNVFFGRDGFTMILSTKQDYAWTLDFAYMVCVFIEKNCIYTSGSKIKYMSPLKAQKELSDYNFPEIPGNIKFTSGILFKRNN